MRDTMRWCLRKILLRVSGAKSYEQLRTVPKSKDINFMIGTISEEEEEKDNNEYELNDFVVEDDEQEENMDIDDNDNNNNNNNYAESNEDINDRDEIKEEEEEEERNNFAFDQEEEISPEDAYEEPYMDRGGHAEHHVLDIDSMDPSDYTVYPTFKEACHAWGFLNNDQEWNLAIIEADKSGASAQQLRDFFCLILVNNVPTNSKQLWEKHKVKFYNDSVYYREGKMKKAENLALLKIQRILQTHGRTLAQFSLPDVIPDQLYDNNIAADLRAEIDYNQEDCEKDWKIAYRKMQNNPQQKAIFEELRGLIDSGTEQDKAYFIDGPGGTGKTTLFNALLSYVRSLPADQTSGDRPIAVACAASGIAAILLAGGRTSHNRFGLGINIDENTSCTYKTGLNKCTRAQILQSAKIIIWDEATMSSKHMVAAVDRCLRDIMNNDMPFGGKLVVFGGDFRQTLGIVEGGNKQAEIDNYIQASNLWPFEIRKLTTNMRVETNSDDNNRARLQWWAQYLLKVGNGEETVPDEIKNEFFHKDIIEIPPEILSDSTTPGDLIDEIYPNLRAGLTDDEIKNSAILTPLNKDVDNINKIAMNKCNGEQFDAVYSEDSVVDEETDHRYSEEYLNRLNVSGMPKHRILLKKGVPIMLLRNLSPIRGLCNGTRLRVDHVGKYVITATIITGPEKNKGLPVLIPRIIVDSKQGKFPGFQLRRKQFPVRIAYAITVNKSQGQTLRNVGLYLPRACFGHGQLYVALSRVGDPNMIKVLVRNTRCQAKLENGKTYTRNVVYKKVLTN